jgi:hypothetical protein
MLCSICYVLRRLSDCFCLFILFLQWRREIEKHFVVGGLSYTVYEGYKFLQQGEGVRRNARSSGKRGGSASKTLAMDVPAAVTGASTVPLRVAAMHPERLAQYDIVLTSFEVSCQHINNTIMRYATSIHTHASLTYVIYMVHTIGHCR